MFRAALSTSDLHMAPPPSVYFPSSIHGLAMTLPPSTQAPVVATRDIARGYSLQTMSSSLPDTLRCGYTSKRCENPRTVKKSGGLHRFCAYHRERANKNQWRVDNRRRLLRKKSRTNTKNGSDCDSPRSTTSETMEEEGCGEDEEKTNDNSSGFVDLLDPAGSPNTLSEQDAKILNAMLFSDEDEPVMVEATGAFEPVKNEEVDAHLTAVPLQDPSCTMSVSTDGSWNCVCSQCLAWPTMFYYQEALGGARKARVQTYGHV